MEQNIRFVTVSDGVRLAYATEGAGRPLVVVPSWISHLELDHQELVEASFFEGLAREHLLVRYDKRGMGLSSRNLLDYSLQAQVNDLDAVVGHLGLHDVTLFGSSQGGVISIAYTVEHPEIVSRLIVFGAYHSIPERTRETMAAVLPLVRTDWVGLGTAPMLEMFVPGASPEVREFFAHYQREAANGEDAAAIMEALAGYDVTDLLPRVRVPTLVLHRADDRAVSMQQGREIASLIPDARFVPLEGRVHLPYWGDTRGMLVAIEDFLGVSVSGSSETGAQLRTVLFTDIVGHAEMMSRLGDERGREVLREHERITREVLKAHGGTEVKTMGDGFMASFGSVTRAVECAVGLQRAFDERNQQTIRVRIGLNAGEPIEEEGDLFGATVILASRIAAKAEGGEILVADVVRGLCSGKGFLFADRGEFVAKGFEEPVRVYEVRWSDDSG
jgi:class 3 adenylate cyclase/pimeloyl-ACP methyl ester carboxylesterase